MEIFIAFIQMVHVGSKTRPDGLPVEQATDDHDDNDVEQLDTDEEALYGGKGLGHESESDTDGDEDKNLSGQGARDDLGEICGQADDSERKPNNFSRIDL